MKPTVTIILAQFGERAKDVEPAFSSYKVAFPGAKFVLYTDADNVSVDSLRTKIVSSPFEKGPSRYGHRSNDYFKIKGLLEADTDVAIAIDSDTLIVSSAVQALPALAERFGLCVPANPRSLVGIDAIVGQEGDKSFSEVYSWCYAVNMTPIAYCRDNGTAKALLTRYLESQTNGPRLRGPLAMWREIWHSGFMPCILPIQWCVCKNVCGCGNEIILHVGQPEVRQYYV